MPVTFTKSNWVVAYEVADDDELVQIAWNGPALDGRHATSFVGPAWPISQYQSCVDWAVSMADFMVHPIHVLPRREDDLFKPMDALPLLSEQDRVKLRAAFIKDLAERLPNCDRLDVGTAADRLMHQLKELM